MDKLKLLLGVVKGKPISRKLLVQLVTSVLVFAGTYALQKFGLEANPAYRSDVSFAAAQIAGLAVGWATKEWPSLLGGAEPAPKPVALSHVRIPISGGVPAPVAGPAAPAKPAALVVSPSATSEAAAVVKPPAMETVGLDVAKRTAPAPEALKLPKPAPVAQPDGQPAEQGPRTITG